MQSSLAVGPTGRFVSRSARRRFLSVAAMLFASVALATLSLAVWVAPRGISGALDTAWAWNLPCTALLLWLMLLLAFVYPRYATPEGMRRMGRLWLFVAPLALLPLVEWMHEGPAMFATTGTLLGVIIYIGMMGAIFFLCGDSRPAQIVVALLWYALAVISAVKTEYRGTPLVPWDIYALRTSVDVASGYSLPINGRMICTLSGIAMFCMVSVKYPVRMRGAWRRLAGAVVMIGGLSGLSWAMLDAASPVYLNIATNNWFLPAVYKNEGFTTALINNCQQLLINRPPRYTPARVATALTESVETQPPGMMTEKPVNVIIVMNESFADLEQVVSFETNRPVMSNLHALQAQSIYGTLCTSVFGGGTSTTEFEVLTGNSSVFLPTESSAYVQYVQPALHNGFSIAQQMREQGYRTVAMHPADPQNWNRDQAYPLMGFDQFYSLEDMPGWDDPANTIRDLYSDSALYRELLSMLKNKPAGERMFVHCVTMQDHGYYDAPIVPDAQPGTWRVDDEQDNGELDTYLTLVGLSDIALQELVDGLAALDEPTLLLFFGDHQPTVARQLPLEETGEDWFLGEPAQRLALYRTPFCIWSNRSLPPVDMGDLSTQYLGGLLMQVAGLPLSDYQRFLSQLRAQWPVFALPAAVDTQGNTLDTDDALQTSPALLDYRMAQYNLMFDVRGKQTRLFQ